MGPLVLPDGQLHCVSVPGPGMYAQCDILNQWRDRNRNNVDTFFFFLLKVWTARNPKPETGLVRDPKITFSMFVTRPQFMLFSLCVP